MFCDDTGFSNLSERKMFEPTLLKENLSEDEGKKEGRFQKNDKNFYFNKNFAKNEKRKSKPAIIEYNLKRKNVAEMTDLNKKVVWHKNMTEMFNLEKIMKDKDKLSFRDSLRLFLFCCCPISAKLKEKKKFYLKAEEKVKEKLDIVFILSKINIFDKFKIIFFFSESDVEVL